MSVSVSVSACLCVCVCVCVCVKSQTLNQIRPGTDLAGGGLGDASFLEEYHLVSAFKFRV